MRKFKIIKSLKSKLIIEMVLSLIITIIYINICSIFIITPYVQKNQILFDTTLFYVFSTGFLISIIAVFVMSFLFMLNRHVTYIKYMAKEVTSIANGNLGHELKVIGADELAQLCININSMSKDLKDKFEHERELEKTKTELITNISHDLRTPLTPIIAYLDILRKKKTTTEEESQEYLNSSYNLSIKLKTLLDELFEYTKLSSKGINLEFTEVDISPILNQILGEYSPILESKGLQVVSPDFNEEILVNIDVEKMVRVFENLLSNAEKYSLKPSEILVNIHKKDGNAIISISNKSDCIKKEELNKIFEKFYRVDTSRSSKIQGSGLGLAISKKIVELHSGKIWAESIGNTIRINIQLPISYKIKL